ncbi:hypothetical protein LCGC14_3031410 [marine sediment metagenome]|uniref:Uncharacterized protein n=1 Tax=marine sediment metagenome TaxID=412755 RepID=A0A0F8ZIF5_9ZZZZ
MGRAFRGPDTVGVDLNEFAIGHLSEVITEGICQECHTSECDNCYGMVVLGHIENQIGEAGIAFMKQMAQDWLSACVDELEPGAK